VLPYWLANPDIAELDLLSEEVPVDDMEVQNHFLSELCNGTLFQKSDRNGFCFAFILSFGI